MKRPKKPKISFRQSNMFKDKKPDGHWDVYRDGKYLGTIIHVFTKPNEYHKFFGDSLDEIDEKPKNMRRGWSLSPNLEDLMNIRPYCPDGIPVQYQKSECFYMFPLLDAKALVRHCLLNNVRLHDMGGHAIMDLARHCRMNELAKLAEKKRKLLVQGRGLEPRSGPPV